MNIILIYIKFIFKKVYRFPLGNFYQPLVNKIILKIFNNL
jgi:hypothetical protein